MKHLVTLIAIMICAIDAVAQTNIKAGIADFVGNADAHVTRSFSEDRTPSDTSARVTSKCDIYTFSLKQKHRQLLTTLLSRFEADRESTNCYSIISHTGGYGVQRNERQLLIGDNPNNYISIGNTQEENYMLLCFTDPEETELQHRYAYVVAWYEEDKEIYGRIIVTYSRIPDHILQQRSHSIESSIKAEFGLGHINSKADFMVAFAMLKRAFMEEQTRLLIAMAIYKMMTEGCEEAGAIALRNEEVAFLRSELQEMIDATDPTLQSAPLSKDDITAGNYLRLAKAQLK